jgi:amino acid transporter
MSRDGLLPKKFAQIHPKYKTPGFSTIMTGVVVGLPIFFTDEAFVLDFTSIGTIFAFVLVCGGVLLLPQRKKGDGKGFRLWYISGQWLFPLICFGSGLLAWIFIPGYISEVIFGGSDMMYTMAHRVLWVCLIGMSVFAWKNKWNIIPLCGVAICLYLLTGMTIENWKWFGIWFFIGLVFYFVYGRRKSKLNEA